MSPNIPFDYDKVPQSLPSPEILIISSSTGEDPAKLLGRTSYSMGAQVEKVRGVDFIEFSTPGGYVSARDIDDIAGLLTHNQISQVAIVIQEDSDFIKALRESLKSRDFVSPLYKKRLVDAITDVRRSGLRERTVTLLSSQGFSHTIASISALNVAKGLREYIADVEGKSSIDYFKGVREETCKHLAKVKVAAYVKTPRDPRVEVVVDLQSISSLAEARALPKGLID